MSRAPVRPGLWGRIEQGVRDHPSDARGDGHLWKRLADLVDPAQYRPELAPDIEIKEFKLRWGNDYAMIANPRDLIHYTLSSAELEAVKLMDGSRTVKEIVLERFAESGDLDLDGVVSLVQSLYEGNMLRRRFLDVDAAVTRAMKPETTARTKARIFARSLTIEWKNADRLVRWFYRNGMKVFFVPPVVLLSVIAAIGGFVAFVTVVRTRDFSLTGESLALGALILMGLNYFLTFCHELGHAVVLTHYKRRVKSAGFQIYFGSPAFFVDASEALMMDRRPRILQALGGPLAEAIVAGIASLVVLVWPDWFLAETLYQFAVLNYVVLFMNLIPLLELDGYFILSDVIQVPDLRPRSLQFIRHDLWHKLRKREGWKKQEVGLALYGVLGVLFTIFSLYTAYFFWKAIFGNLIIQMWNGGFVSRVVLLALGVLVAGPIVRGVLKLIGAVVRRVRAVIRRIRFKLELKWRVEAAEMIDALPTFKDIPVEVLNDLAGRVRLRQYAPGQPVFRQGDAADAFFVVRRGRVQVVEENRETGNERIIATLDRGQSFGELALIQETVRSATVRALEETELFEVDRGTFDRLLADMVEVLDFVPTLQQFAELQSLPPFANLTAERLAEVLDHGDWVNLPPEEDVVVEGAPGDAFYAIASGQVEVVRDGEVVDAMGPGRWFGEVALLMDVPRTATIRTRTPVRAFRLERAGFDRLVADSFRRGTLRPNIAVGRTQEH